MLPSSSRAPSCLLFCVALTDVDHRWRHRSMVDGPKDLLSLGSITWTSVPCRKSSRATARLLEEIHRTGRASSLPTSAYSPQIYGDYGADMLCLKGFLRRFFTHPKPKHSMGLEYSTVCLHWGGAKGVCLGRHVNQSHGSCLVSPTSLRFESMPCRLVKPTTPICTVYLDLLKEPGNICPRR